MEALADKVHKQGDHIPQFIATFHTTIPTQVVMTISISTATYVCRDGCVKGSNVVKCDFLVCVLCQPVPPFMHPPIPTFDPSHITRLHGHPPQDMENGLVICNTTTGLILTLARLD